MSNQNYLQNLTTEQEFMLALELIGRCTSSLRCGCDVSGCELDTISLKYKCKDYLQAFEEFALT